MESKQERKRKQVEFEFDGRTIEEALEKALAALKVDREDLDVRVLSEEEKGLFGMAGGKPARIQVKLKKK
jgi:spoIIIJ-associated protein